MTNIFSKLNGWTIPASVKNSPSKKLTHRGELSSRFNGRPTRHRRSIETSFTINTAKLDEMCADTLEGLIEGENHHFHFIHDVWSDAGLGPQAGDSWDLQTDGPPATRGFYVEVLTDLVYNARFIDDPAAPGGGRWGISYLFLNAATWERRVLRSDGSRWIDGVPTVTSFSEVVVTAGSVAFTGGTEIADLSLLSFYPCDSFVVADNEWVRGLDVVANIPLNDNYAEVQQGLSLHSVAGAAPFGKGQIGRALDLNGSTQGVAYNADPAFDIFGKDEFSVALWARLDVDSGGNQTLITHDNGSTGSGWLITKATTGIGFTVVTTGTNAHHFITAPADGELFMIVATFDLATMTVGAFLNGEQRNQTVQIGTGTVVSDVANTLSLGYRRQTNIQHWDGVIGDVRIFDKVLSAAEVAAMYECEREGLSQYPGPRFSSAMPSLDLWGAVAGCREPVAVSCEVTGETYVQHGSDAGWVNNDREMSIKLDVVKSKPEQDKIPDPDLAWVFQPQQIEDPTAATSMPKPIAGRFALSGVGVTLANRGKQGPFNLEDKAWEFNGDYANVNEADFGNFLYGAASCSIFAWVKTPTPLTTQTIFESYIDNTPNLRLQLRFQSGRVEVRARSQAADSLQTASGIALAGNAWVCVGAIVDVANDTARLFINGVEDDEDAMTFGAGRFDGATPTVSPYGRLGQNAAVTAQWLGQIAGVYLWRRKISDGEMLRLYELGKKGIFS